MKYRNMTHTNRWEDKESYKKEWSTRSDALIEMFLRSEVDSEEHYELSEFGCGPYAPFSTALKNNDKFNVRKYDIKAWDAETNVIDLNDPNFEFGPADIATFSGVLEYLNDIQDVLEKAITHHRYLLVSYVFLPADAKSDDTNYLKIIKNRSVTNGFRNHLSNEDFVKILSALGVIADIGLWGDQALFIVRRSQ